MDVTSERLKKLASKLKGLDFDDFQAFKHWSKEIICRGLPEDVQKKVTEIFEKNEGVDSMISNVTIAIREDRKKSRQEGIKEGIVKGRAEVVIKLLAKKFGQITKDLIAKINAATEPQMETLIDNILQIQSLEEVNEYLRHT